MLKLYKELFEYVLGQIRRILDDNASDTHKTVAHLIPDNIVAILTPY